MLPAVLALGVYQINIIVLNQLASFLDEGSVSFLWLADRLQQFPLGVFGIAIATASLPAFSDAHVDRGADGLVQAFGQSMRLNAFIIVPATAGLWLLALPLCATVYQHGVFDHAMAQATTGALVAFAVGLPAVASIRVAAQAFFAMKDTRTPVACGVVGLMGNVAFGPGLAVAYGFVGLALSASLAGWLQLLTQLFFLRRRLGRIGLKTIVAGLLRSLAATVPMLAVVYVGAERLGDWRAGTTVLNLCLLLLIVGVGAAVYAAVHLVIRTPELTTMIGGIRRRLRRR
jgi:putative peptidoglycan lipid II flippase